MKVNANFTVVVYFKEGERDEANEVIDPIVEAIMRQGMNIEIAWDTDHVRVTGRKAEEW